MFQGGTPPRGTPGESAQAGSEQSGRQGTGEDEAHTTWADKLRTNATRRRQGAPLIGATVVGRLPPRRTEEGEPETVLRLYAYEKVEGAGAWGALAGDFKSQASRFLDSLGVAGRLLGAPQKTEGTGKASTKVDMLVAVGEGRAGAVVQASGALGIFAERRTREKNGYHLVWLTTWSYTAANQLKAKVEGARLTACRSGLGVAVPPEDVQGVQLLVDQEGLTVRKAPARWDVVNVPRRVPGMRVAEMMKQLGWEVSLITTVPKGKTVVVVLEGDEPKFARVKLPRGETLQVTRARPPPPPRVQVQVKRKEAHANGGGHGQPERKQQRPQPKPLKRKDPGEQNGRVYTRLEFLAWYGSKKGKRLWRQAGDLLDEAPHTVQTNTTAPDAAPVPAPAAAPVPAPAPTPTYQQQQEEMIKHLTALVAELREEVAQLRKAQSSVSPEPRRTDEAEMKDEEDTNMSDAESAVMKDADYGSRSGTSREKSWGQRLAGLVYSN